MRRWIQRVVIIALLLGGLVATMRYLFRDEIRAAAIARTKAELEAIVIPHFELRDATFPEALAYLETQARKLGLRLDIRFVELSDAEVQKVFRRRLSEAQLEGSTLPDVSPRRYAPTITLSLTNVPVPTALTYISALAGHLMRIVPDGVEFAHAQGDFPLSMGDGTIEPLITRTMEISPGLIWMELSPSSKRQPDESRDVRQYLESLGITFYEGSSAEFDPVTGALTIHNTEEQIDFLEMMIGHGGIEDTFIERIRKRIRGWFPSTPDGPAVPAIPGLEPLPGSD